VTKSEFGALLLRSLEAAAESAERRLGISVSRNFEIQFEGFAPHRRKLTGDQAVDELYVGTDRFYRVVDMGVIEVRKDRTVVFMRVSGHPPSSFADTWNQPKGAGPFKQIESAVMRREGDAV
jgi:hypothetical protein